MSGRSLATLYKLAGAGETVALLAHIADLLAEEPQDQDPANFALIAAAEENHLETVQALLGIGANIEGASQRSYIRPLWRAAKRGHLEMVRLLIDKGANAKSTDNRNMTALDYARRYSHTDVTKYLESLT